MGTTPDEVREGAILPAPACDLIDRLTNELGIPFTLTDLQGTVVVSTGDRLAGSVEPAAASVLEAETPVEIGGEAAGPDQASDSGVGVPVRLTGRIAGVLIAHGDPAEMRTAARMAAVTIGMALDFAEAASVLGRKNVTPSWLLYRLLRGSREEAHQARVMAAIFGWNLFVQRIAIVISPTPEQVDARSQGHDPLELIEEALGTNADATPFGQVDEDQWVVLWGFEPQPRPALQRQAAERLRATFAARGLETNLGIGESHLSLNPVLAIRRSYREAIYSARIGAHLQGKSGVYDLHSLGPAAFLAPSGSSRRKLAELLLEPLRARPAIFRSLTAYLDLEMSVAEAAERLGVHRHTIRNHLERIFDLTGFDPRSLEGAVQLKLALLVAASTPEQQEP